jgi:3-phosphoshikimate 1-carboxyvinyltransferase
MGRIITPLTLMGAAIESDCDGTPPLQLSGGLRLHAIDYDLPIASAQVKSAILLAGLYAAGRTSVTEPAVTRDHTERMLSLMGVDISARGGTISIAGGQDLRGCAVEVPGDFSSATFIILATLLSQDADIIIKSVGVNPTRTGIIDILKAGRWGRNLLRICGFEPHGFGVLRLIPLLCRLRSTNFRRCSSPQPPRRAQRYSRGLRNCG